MLRVLIPSCTDGLLQHCFESLERSEAGSIGAVIVGDNGLSSAFRVRWPQVTYVSVPRPFVYSATINRCAGAAGTEDDLLIVGDDSSVLTSGWLGACESLLAGWPDGYGLLNLSEPSTAEIYGRAASPDAPIEARSTLAFVASVIPRRVWDEVGPMDQRFLGYGFDDTDYCLRLLHAGYRIGITGAAMIRHQGSASYGPVSSEGNRDLFEAKWGVRVEPGFMPSAPHYRRQECHCASIGS